MIESTARAERTPAESPSRPGYLWEVPQKPVSVYLPIEMIDRLESLVVENFRSLTSRGSEIGGLLVGRSGQGSPLVVLVENFEIVPCDYSRGPLYRLSEADMGRFERVMEQYSGGAGPRVVGYFRSHTRKGLALDPDDLAFLEARFREPQHIALLVRPFASKPSTGAIFIRENGTIRAEGSYLEFPFRSSQLTASPNPPKIETGIAAAEPPASAAAPAPAAQKPPVRGQIVPIASRREIAVPPPEPVPEPVPAPVVEPVPPAPVQASTPAPAPKPPAEPVMRTAEKKVEKKAERVDKKAEKAEKAEKVEAKPAPRKSEVAVPKAFAEAEAAQRETAPASGGNKLVWILAVLALAAVLVGGYMLIPGFHKTPRVPAGSSDISDLALRVEHSGPDLLLTWNRDSYGAKNGKHGVLQVFDGDSRQNYEIDREGLTSGLGVVYSPQTQDVSFQMSVTDEKGVEIGKGGQRVLHPRPSPMDDPKAVSAANKPAPAAAKNDAPAEAAPAAPAEAAPAAEKATRKFDQASLGNNRIRPASTTDLSNALPDAPSVGGAGAAPQAASLPGGNLAGIAPPPPRQAAPPPPTAKNAPSQISQAQLVYKRDPEYPKMAQQMNLKGIVELVATIGVDGKVKGVRVLKGPPMLTKAAQEAVMQWVYKPTLLNGTPVENETHISINFAAQK